VFAGFRPANAGSEDRTAVGAYVDLEANVTDKFLASVAVRGEHYSDFGENLSGKIAARYDFTESFALRASVQNGFRAPSLQQQFFQTTSTNFLNGIPFDVTTFPVTDPIARAMGAKDLDAEESINFSIGAVLRLGQVDITIDAYRIDIDDRIVLSENLGGRADVDAILAPFSVSRARFFLNGVDTKTEGVDLVLRYGLPTESAGKFDFTLSGNMNSTEIEKLPELGGGTINPPIPLFARINSLTFEEGTPEEKAAFTADWELPRNFGSFGTLLKAVYYGEVTEPGTAANGSLDIHMGSAVLLDLELNAEVGDGLRLAIGADNILDKYPTPVPSSLNATGALGYSRYSAFGFGGRFLYARLGYRW
jgi:iron complex outermembrane recepter protein